MIVAIAKDGTVVSQHFGQCEGYSLFVIEEGRIVSREEIANPGHAPGVLPQLMADKNADIVIAGGMGPKAIDNFCLHGIDVILGVSGSIDDAIERFINGELQEGTNVCHH